MYEFGVVQGSAYKAWQAYSTSSHAALTGLPAGATTVYVCVRAGNTQATSAASSNSANAVGLKTCATATIEISAQVTQQQVAQQIAALKSAAYVTTTSATLGMAQKLAAVATVTNGTADNSTTGSVAALASSLLTQLVDVSSEVNDTSSVLAVFGGVSTLWSMADASGKAAAVSGVSSFSEKLATQVLTASDAQPLVDLFTQMLDSATEIVTAQVSSNTSSASNTTNTTAAAAAAARDLLASVTKAAAALTQGLLNGAPDNGTAVFVTTARLSTAVQRVSAALAASGYALSLPIYTNASDFSGRRRHLLAAAASGMAQLSSSVGPLCAADTACSANGLSLTVTTMSDTSVLSTALGGSFAPLVANQPGYRAGGTVRVISPIVHVAVPGLPSAAFGLPGLVRLDLPVNTSALDASATRVLVRLQDFGAAPADASAGIAAAVSVTTTNGTLLGVASGSSNSLGDFVVVQYTGGATGAAGPALLPSSLLVSLLAGLATLAVVLLA